MQKALHPAPHPGGQAVVHRQAQEQIGQGDAENEKPDLAFPLHHGLQHHLLHDGRGVQTVEKAGGQGGAQQYNHGGGSFFQVSPVCSQKTKRARAFYLPWPNDRKSDAVFSPGGKKRCFWREYSTGRQGCQGAVSKHFSPLVRRRGGVGLAYSGKVSSTCRRPDSHRAEMVPPRRWVSSLAMDRPRPVDWAELSTV